MVSSQQKNKSGNNNELDGLINEAMEEVSNKQLSLNTSFQIPVEILYLSLLLLIVVFVFNKPYSNDTHPSPTSHAFESGQRIGLLTIAEEINAYEREHGKLPNKIPSTFADIMQVTYNKIGKHHYELIMPIFDGELILDGQGTHEEIHTELNGS